MRCAWWCWGSATGSFPRPVTCLCTPPPPSQPPHSPTSPTVSPFSRPFSPSLFSHTHSSAVITEQALYKRPGSSPSVQPHHRRAHKLLQRWGPLPSWAPAHGSSKAHKLSFPVLSPCVHFSFIIKRNSVSSRLIHLALIRLRCWQILNPLQRGTDNTVSTYWQNTALQGWNEMKSIWTN